MSCEKKCPVCGKAFTAEKNGIKYCSPMCKKKASGRPPLKKKCEYCMSDLPPRRKKYCSDDCYLMANGRKGDKAGKFVFKKSKRKLPMADINERARAEGLSYGQYVAKYNI